MKKSLLVLTTAIMAMFFVSCGSLADSISGGVKMDTPQAAEKVIETLKKNINFDEWKVYNLHWTEGERLENDLTSLSVSMVNKGNACFSQTFTIGGIGEGTIGNLRDASRIGQTIEFAAFEGITPEMIKPEIIQKQYDEAKSMIPAEYEFRSIKGRQMKIAFPSGNTYADRNKKFGVIEEEFSVLTTEIGKEYIESAGKKSIQYFEADFNVLPDGSIEIDD